MLPHKEVIKGSEKPSATQNFVSNFLVGVGAPLAGVHLADATDHNQESTCGIIEENTLLPVPVVQESIAMPTAIQTNKISLSDPSPSNVGSVAVVIIAIIGLALTISYGLYDYCHNRPKGIKAGCVLGGVINLYRFVQKWNGVEEEKRLSLTKEINKVKKVKEPKHKCAKPEHDYRLFMDATMLTHKDDIMQIHFQEQPPSLNAVKKNSQYVVRRCINDVLDPKLYKLRFIKHDDQFMNVQDKERQFDLSILAHDAIPQPSLIGYGLIIDNEEQENQNTESAAYQALHGIEGGFMARYLRVQSKKNLRKPNAQKFYYVLTDHQDPSQIDTLESFISKNDNIFNRGDVEPGLRLIEPLFKRLRNALRYANSRGVGRIKFDIKNVYFPKGSATKGSEGQERKNLENFLNSAKLDDEAFFETQRDTSVDKDRSKRDLNNYRIDYENLVMMISQLLYKIWPTPHEALRQVVDERDWNEEKEKLEKQTLVEKEVCQKFLKMNPQSEDQKKLSNTVHPYLTLLLNLKVEETAEAPPGAISSDFKLLPKSANPIEDEIRSFTARWYRLNRPEKTENLVREFQRLDRSDDGLLPLQEIADKSILASIADKKKKTVDIDEFLTIFLGHIMSTAGELADIEECYKSFRMYLSTRKYFEIPSGRPEHQLKRKFSESFGYKDFKSALRTQLSQELLYNYVISATSYLRNNVDDPAVRKYINKIFLLFAGEPDSCVYGWEYNPCQPGVELWGFEPDFTARYVPMTKLRAHEATHGLGFMHLNDKHLTEHLEGLTHLNIDELWSLCLKFDELFKTNEKKREFLTNSWNSFAKRYENRNETSKLREIGFSRFDYENALETRWA